MSWLDAYKRYVSDAFPKLRPSQAEILSRIPDDARLVVISAPTGVGKSLIGIIQSIADSGVYESKSGIGPGGPHVYIVTPTKGLQDQYKGTLQKIYLFRNWAYLVLKGRQNYSCPLFKGKTAADCPFLNAWQGGKRFCPYKPRRSNEKPKGDWVRTADGMYLIPPGERWCPYWLDKFEALRSHFVVFNYHYFFNEFFYVGDFPFADVVVFDEVHTVFDVLESMVSLRVTPGVLSRWGIQLGSYYSSPNIYVNALYNAVHARLIDIEARLMKVSDSIEDLTQEERSYYYSLVSLYNELYEALTKLGFFRAYRSYFFASFKLVRDGYLFEFRPLPHFFAYVINRLLFPLTKGSPHFTFRIIALSATPGPKSFWERLAYLAHLKPHEFAYIDYPRSPFPVQNRLIFIPSDAPYVTETALKRQLGTIYENADQVELYGTKHIYRSSIVMSQAYLVERLYNMMGRVLVHTWNNKLAYLLYVVLREQGIPVVFPRERPTEEIQKWSESGEESVMITAAAKEGVDLAYDRARVQVVLKLPVPNLRDRYTQYIRRHFTEFYKYRIASALVQQAGRVVRSKDDWGYTIIYDAAVKRFVFNNPGYFPPYFREALVTRFNTQQVLEYIANDYIRRLEKEPVRTP